MNKKLILILLLIIVFGTFLYIHYSPDEQQIPFTSQPAETSEDTSCKSDEECWCRSFTGAEFITGEKVPHRCNLETNRCLPCYYE